MALEQLPDQYLYALLKNYGLSSSLPENLQMKYGSMSDADYTKISQDMAQPSFWAKYDMNATGQFVGANQPLSKEEASTRLGEVLKQIDNSNPSTKEQADNIKDLKDEANQLRVQLGNGFIDRQGRYNDFTRRQTFDTNGSLSGERVLTGEELAKAVKEQDIPQFQRDVRDRNINDQRLISQNQSVLEASQKSYNDWMAMTEADKKAQGLLGPQFTRPGVFGSWEYDNAGYVSNISKYDYQKDILKSGLDAAKLAAQKVYSPNQPDERLVQLNTLKNQMAGLMGVGGGYNVLAEQQAYFDAHPEYMDQSGNYIGPGSTSYYGDMMSARAANQAYMNRPQIPGSTGATTDFQFGNTFGWNQQQQQGWVNNGTNNVFYGNSAIPDQTTLNGYFNKGNSTGGLDAIKDTSASSLYNQPYSNVGSLFNDPLNNKNNTGSLF